MGITLNSGFAFVRDEDHIITQDERELINDFIKTGKMKVVAPGSASGNEATRATNLRVTELRRNFRSKKRAEAKAKQNS